jgi:hypothetical protein
LFAGPVLYLAASWVLKRRFLMFHFWSAKAGAALLFCLWPLMAVTQSELWLPLAAWGVGLSRIEHILLIWGGGRYFTAPHGLAPIPPTLEVQR